MIFALLKSLLELAIYSMKEAPKNTSTPFESPKNNQGDHLEEEVEREGERDGDLENSNFLIIDNPPSSRRTRRIKKSSLKMKIHKVYESAINEVFPWFYKMMEEPFEA